MMIHVSQFIGRISLQVFGNSRLNGPFSPGIGRYIHHFNFSSTATERESRYLSCLQLFELSLFQ